MPRGDRTGPAGMGSMTGRAAGYCAGYNAPGFANPAPGFGRGMGFGRGFGRGLGRGFGRGYWRFAPVPAAPEVAPAPGFVPAPAYGYQPTQPQVRYTKENEIADLTAEKELVERDIETMKKGLEDIAARLKELEKKQ